MQHIFVSQNVRSKNDNQAMNWQSHVCCAIDLLQIKKEHQTQVQDLLPLLEMVAEQHPSEKIKDMACDLRIAIATHGAVWSHRMNVAAKTLGQDSETVKVDSRSATTKGS